MRFPLRFDSTYLTYGKKKNETETRHEYREWFVNDYKNLRDFYISRSFIHTSLHFFLDEVQRCNRKKLGKLDRVEKCYFNLSIYVIIFFYRENISVNIFCVKLVCTHFLLYSCRIFSNDLNKTNSRRNTRRSLAQIETYRLLS